MEDKINEDWNIELQIRIICFSLVKNLNVSKLRKSMSKVKEKPPFQLVPISAENFKFEIEKTYRYPDIDKKDEEEIDRFWEEGVKPNFPNFNTGIPIANLERIEIYEEGDKIKIKEVWGEIYYKEFVAAGTKELGKANISEKTIQKINHRSYTGIVRTKDGKIVMAVREENVLGANKKTTIPQGMIRLKEDEDPLSATKKRMKKELGPDLDDEIIEKIVLLDYCIHDEDYRDVSIGFLFEINLTWNELKEKAKVGGFNRDLQCIEDKPEEIYRFIKNWKNISTYDTIAHLAGYLIYKYPEKAKEYLEKLEKTEEFRGKESIVVCTMQDLLSERYVDVKGNYRYKGEMRCYGA